MAQSAKDYAKKQLGKLDLSYLDNERDVANKVYNTSKSSLENNFNNLIDQVKGNREDTRRNFNLGRATVAEKAYNTNRTNQADLASRGVGNSGLKGLSEVGNRMETGRQYSNLANDFYSKMNELDTTEKQGKSQYDIDQQTIKNTLDQNLANVNSRGAEANNSYNMTLGQLAENIQGRWDSNANAQAALAQQRAAAAQAHNDALNAARQNLKSTLRSDLNSITTNNNLSDDDKVNQITTQFNVDRNTAINLLLQLGRWNKNYTSTGDTNYNNKYDYTNDIFNKYISSRGY